MKKNKIFLPMVAATLLLSLGLAACNDSGNSKPNSSSQGGGGGGGSFVPHDEDEEPFATLHMEDADHYSADGEWTNSSRGPGETPVYEKSSASDGTCVGYFGEGDKETLTFTSDKAVTAELCITMGNNNSYESLAEVEEVKFNDKAINLEEVAYESNGSGSGDYTFSEVSFGLVDIKTGQNVLAFEFLDSAPYLDDVNFYGKNKATLTVVPAPQKEQIVINNPESELTIEEGATVQLSTTPATGIEFTSSSESVAEVSDTGLVTGIAKGSATITAKKDGMLSAKVTIKVTEKLVAGEIRVQIESGTGEGITFRTSYNTDTEIVDAWPKDAVLTLEFTSTLAGEFDLFLIGRASGGYQGGNTDDPAEKMEIKVNGGAAVALSGEIAGGAFGTYKIGVVTLQVGANTMTVKGLTDDMTTIDFFKLQPKA